MTQKGKFKKPEAARYLEYKEKVGWIARFNGVQKIKGDIGVKCRFYVNGGHIPDTDNLVKAVLDSLNDIGWDDDRQVARIDAERIIGTPERAEIEITEADASVQKKGG
jgi:Holliday junction resolvase RusA-like endonuclease